MVGGCCDAVDKADGCADHQVQLVLLLMIATHNVCMSEVAGGRHTIELEWLKPFTQQDRLEFSIFH